jgi:hypothetical protein
LDSCQGHGQHRREGEGDMDEHLLQAADLEAVEY